MNQLQFRHPVTYATLLLSSLIPGCSAGVDSSSDAAIKARTLLPGAAADDAGALVDEVVSKRRAPLGQVETPEGPPNEEQPGAPDVGSSSPPQAPSNETCSINDTRTCVLFLPPFFLPVPYALPYPGAALPALVACAGSCTSICCSLSGDQELCGVSNC
jgi:hypothetical protein